MTPQTTRKPPAVAAWLLRRLLPLDRQNETIRGDLLEEYRRRSAGDGRRAANLWYRREALSLLVRGYGYKKMLTLDNLRQDLRFAWRSYARARSFTALVVLTLALGIGASTAIFSIVNGVLLRPLPFPEPERLMYITEATSSGNNVSVSWMNYLDWRTRLHSFETLAASRGSTFTLTGIDQAKRVPGRTVTATFFPALGAQPFLGRAFTEADDKPGAPGVAIVSHEFWRRQLAADPAAVGRTITLDAHPYTVVGVMPAGFRYLRDYDVFVAMGPLAAAPWTMDRDNHQGYVGLARLEPGVTAETAARELQSVEADLAREYPASNTGLVTVVEPLASRLVVQLRDTLLVLAGAVGILLLVACVNVANLLIARGSTRTHELAVRAALGGNRLRLVTQLLVESSLLSAAGGALGIALASVLLRVLIAVAPEGTPRLDEVSLDMGALIFAVAAAAACGLLFGAFPAAQASRASGRGALLATRSDSATGTHRLRRGLLVAEVALAIVLLTGAGLMMRTLARLTSVDTGFKADHLLTLRLSVPEVTRDNARRIALMNEVLGRLRSLPGVSVAAAGYSLPIDGSNWNSTFAAQGKPIPPSHDQLPSAAMVPISPAYFDALGTRLTRGRFFTDADGATSAPVAIVNETLVRRLWPGEDPIGKRVKQGWPEEPGAWREVVGVVEDIKFDGIAEAMTLQVYMPFAQDPPSGFSVLLRTAVPPASLARNVEAAVASIDRDMPVYEMKPMADLLGQSIARQRMALLVLGVFAAVALVLAATGLYGLVAHSVTERTHEIGVRMALGAARGDVVRLVVRQGLSMTIAGTLIGIIGAAALSGSLHGLVFGVDPIDPATFASVIVMLFAVALAACYVPAWRAARIPPVTALRM